MKAGHDLVFMKDNSGSGRGSGSESAGVAVGRLGRRKWLWLVAMGVLKNG